MPPAARVCRGTALAACLVFVGAFVGATLRGGDDALTAELAACAAAAALLLFGARYPPRRDWLGSGVTWLLTTTALAAWAGVLRVYAVGFLATPLLLWWVDVVAARGDARYEPHVRGFVITRAAAYASTRAFGAALVAHAALPARLAALLPATFGVAESAWMACVAEKAAYAFPGPRAFAEYATVKTVVLLAVPRLEQALTTLA
jgi:hypothetical protein